jgi:hypothetical protein
MFFGLPYLSYLARRLRDQGNQLEPTELEVRETGLVVTARGMRAEVSWSKYRRLRDAPGHFMLYQSADLYAIVPKRAFATDTEAAAFRAIALKAIGDGRPAVEQ